MNRFLQSAALGLMLFPIEAVVAADTNISGYEIVVTESPVDNRRQKQLVVNCPAGKRVLSAGWGVLDPTGATMEGAATFFAPSFDGKGWTTNAKIVSATAEAWKLRVRLICAKAP